MFIDYFQKMLIMSCVFSRIVLSIHKEVGFFLLSVLQMERKMLCLILIFENWFDTTKIILHQIAMLKKLVSYLLVLFIFVYVSVS